MRSFKKLIYGIVLKGETSDPTDNIEGSIWHNSTSNKFKSYIGGAVRELATADQSQVLINKTIDADLNTITNIDNSEIKTGAAIARNKLASGSAFRVVTNDGSGVMADAAAITAARALISDANGIPTHSTVTSTELETLSGLSGDILTTTNTKTVSNKTLDNTNVITVADDNFTIQDDGDPTKQAQFQASGITTGTTRTFTFPDADTTLVGTDTTQTLSNKTLTTPTIAVINGVDTINGVTGAALDILAASGQDVNIQGATGQDVVIETITFTDNLIAGASGTLTELRSTAANLYLNAGGNLNIDSSATINVTAGAGGTSNIALSGGFSLTRNIQTIRANDGTATGADADVTLPTASYVKLTNVSLTSVRSIGAGANGQKLVLTNDTGVTITVRNESAGATAANRILTGSGSDLTMRNNSSIDLVYDNDDARWRVVGGPGGSDNLAVTTQTNTNYTALVSDEVILFSTGGTDRTLTLPAVSGNTGKKYYVKKIDSGAGKVVVDGDGSETIDDSLTYEIISQHEAVTIICDGSVWRVF